MNARKRPSGLAPFAALFTTLLGANALAGEPSLESHVIKVLAGEGEVIEADVTDLALGETQSFVTDSGSTVDILRAPEGMEIYIDGELVDSDFGREELHAHAERLHERMDLDCHGEDEADCEEHFSYTWSTEGDADQALVVVQRDVEVICDSDENCDTQVLVSRGDDVDFGQLRETTGKHVIVIDRDVSIHED